MAIIKVLFFYIARSTLTMYATKSGLRTRIAFSLVAIIELVSRDVCMMRHLTLTEHTHHCSLMLIGMSLTSQHSSLLLVNK